jgi:hypothetical protein
VCTGLSSAPTNIRQSGVSKKGQRLLGHLGLQNRPLGISTTTPNIVRTHYNSETPRPRCSSVWKRFDRVSKLSLYCFCSCALLSVCVHVVAVIELLCACYHPPYSKFDCDHLCKAVRDPKPVEIPHKRVWYKEEYRGTQVWYLDHLREVECNLWLKEVTTSWSRLWPNHGKKSSCLLSIYFTVISIFLWA